MCPVLFRIGTFDITSFGVMVAIGALRWPTFEFSLNGEPRTLAAFVELPAQNVERGEAVRAVSRRDHWHREMDIAVREFSDRDYPENPARRSVQYGKYSGRRLTLAQRDNSRFDFIFVPHQPHVAEVAFRNVDVSLMTPSLPAWTRDDAGLRRIALTDRQWNR